MLEILFLHKQEQKQQAYRKQICQHRFSSHACKDISLILEESGNRDLRHLAKRFFDILLTQPRNGGKHIRNFTLKSKCVVAQPDEVERVK